MTSNPILINGIVFIARAFRLVVLSGAGEAKSVAMASLFAALLIPFTSGCDGGLTVGPDYKLSKLTTAPALTLCPAGGD